MMMKAKLTTLALALFTPTALWAAEEAPQGPAVAKALAAQSAGFKDQSMHIHMRLETPDGQSATRDLRVKVLERPGQAPFSLVLFESPRDVEGTALLSKEGDQWLYLPAMRRVRRISSSHRSGPFMGSEFSYEDLMGNDPAQYAWKTIGKEACGDAQCLVVETTPRFEGSGYSRRVLYLRDSDHRLERIEFFDRGGAKLKTLHYRDYQTHQGRFVRAHTWDMTNHQTSKRTVLELSDVRFGVGLSEGDFAPAKLSRAR